MQQPHPSASRQPAPQQQSAAQAPGSAIGPAAHIQPPPAGFTFPLQGQTLVYEVEWRLFNAGTATLRLEAAGQEKRVVGAADATGVVELLYHVADRFQSHFDPATFCSVSVSKHTEEGRRRLDTKIRFDYAHGKAVLDETNLRTSQRKQQESDVPRCVTDVLTGIFYLGSLPLAPSGVYTFPLNDGGKTVNVRAVVETREEVKVPAGTYNTVRVQPEATSGVVKERGRMWVWYSDDAQHLPVQIRARMFWGTLTLRLQRIDKK